MNHRQFPPSSLNFISIIFCIFVAIPSSNPDDSNEECSACNHSYLCGSALGNIWYPFWVVREGFELKCHENQTATIVLGSQTFRVLDINYPRQTMTVAGDDPWRNFCLTTFDQTLLSYDLTDIRNLSLFYDCSDGVSNEPNKYVYHIFDCPEQMTGFYMVDDDGKFKNLSSTCKGVIKFPVPSNASNNFGIGPHLQKEEWLTWALRQGFEVMYNEVNERCSGCSNSSRICGSDSSNNFSCLCRDESRPSTCAGPPGGTRRTYLLKIGIGVFAILIGLTIMSCILIYNCKRKKKNSSITSTSSLIRNAALDQDFEAFIRNYGPLATKRYTFSDVKKMTSSFMHKLGQGGYGDVYKGKLSNGHLVAVKLLNSSKGNGQEFINEVASISRTSHVNVVTLLGFCLEGNNRALIYDFMPNGSLDKFIHNKDTLEISQHLGWEKLYQIAIGIARGLEYLHRGCNTRILHFDIKPHNILLDGDFCPKISDFGLAKLCLKKESIVSMLEARGTIGYIAPEVFCRNFGQVSHKSDVYSYGMMVLEMVGGKKNLAVEVVNTSEIYFPQWIYTHVEQGIDEFRWYGVNNKEENEIAQKMIIVGLWCIQTDPSDRPSINKVINMLQGSVEALQIPPKPFLSSPPRPIDHCTTSSST